MAKALPNRYADPRPIGRGGMGQIYLAEDRELGRKVAIKVLDDRFAGNEQLRERFKREALAAARLSGHPHVVTIFDIGESQGRPFIVMEYLPGGTLGDRTRQGPVEPGEALSWLGRVADDTLTGMTATGTVLGTAGYLAPEQALGQPATSASDRYALGVIGYELLTGGRPFERQSETAEAAAHIHEPVPPASERHAGLPRAVDGVFDRALSKDPGERYSTGADFVSALGNALERRETTTRLLPAAPPPPGRGAPRGRPPWAIPLLLAALVAALVAGLLVAAMLTSQDDNNTTAPPTQGPVTVTAEETVGTTVVTTVVTTTPEAPSGQVSLDEAVQLTDEATQLLGEERWEEALRTQRRALDALEDTYSDDFRYEAYAAYNMGKALAELGRCEQAFRYLDRSEELQGQRDEIDDARAKCEEGG